MKLGEVAQEQWRELCQELPPASIYQDPRWLDLIAVVYPRLRIRRLVCRDSGGGLCWLLPLVEIVPLGRRRPMLISLPFGNYGGFLRHASEPLAPDSFHLQPLQEFFEQQRATVLEIREPGTPTPGLQAMDYFRRFEVELPADAAWLWEKGIARVARKCVRKAARQGVEIVRHHPQAGTIFQRLYEVNAGWHGTPLHHSSWYERLLELFHREAEIFLARQADRFIGALLVFHYRGLTVLHAAETDPRYRRVPASDLLHWSVFASVIERKMSARVDFGRTRPEAGKLFFKRKWGGVEKPLYYSYLLKPGAAIPQLVPDNPQLAWAIKAWRRLPLALQRRLGPWFRPRIPT